MSNEIKEGFSAMQIGKYMLAAVALIEGWLIIQKLDTVILYLRIIINN
jgi:hypothetical protein